VVFYFLKGNVEGCGLSASFGIFPLLESLAAVGLSEVLEDDQSELCGWVNLCDVNKKYQWDMESCYLLSGSRRAEL
jgi:hypothetical protein